MRPRYRVVTELGAGGTADVFLAIFDEPGGGPTLCVLKTPRRGLGNNDELMRMFRRESRLAARLRHPNIVEVLEIVEDHGQPVLAMEFLEGASLREFQRMLQQTGESVPLREQVRILQEVCHGLHYCHELRDLDGSAMEIVHRDVSPHNVFLTFDDRVKLLDFGIAKLTGAERDTETGFVKGKLRYMAPEHMMGAEVDRRADVYAIGVLLWEAITGRPMWEDVNDAVLMQRTVHGDLPDPQPLVEGCAPPLVAITRRALALDPADRFPTCEALAEALDAVLPELPVSGATFGEITGALFADRRQRLHEQVQAVLSVSSRSATGPIEWHKVATNAGTLTLGRRARTEVPTARRSTGLIVGMAVGSAALATVAWLGLQQTQRHALENMRPTMAGLAPRAVEAPLLGLPESSASDVRIAIDVEPAQAELRLDGAALSPPYDLTVPRDGKEHLLSIRAEGFEDLERTVVFDRDLRISLRLDREVRPVAPPPQGRKSRPSRRKAEEKPEPPAAPVESAKPREDCDPPFVLDASGIKRFKRQCL